MSLCRSSCLPENSLGLSVSPELLLPAQELKGARFSTVVEVTGEAAADADADADTTMTTRATAEDSSDLGSPRLRHNEIIPAKHHRCELLIN